MNLQEATTRLLELIPLLNEAGEAYSNAQYESDTRKFDLYIHQAQTYRNAEGREAYVGSVLEEEGLTEDLLRAKSKWRKLQNEREMLEIVSANLRALSR